MIFVRDAILTVTILALIYIADNHPRPIKSAQVDYCVIEYKAAGKDLFGNVVTGWAKGYGPCKLQDKFFEI